MTRRNLAISFALSLSLLAACGPPDEPPELSFELLELNEEAASELARRAGLQADCAPVEFVEGDGEIDIICLYDVPLGQARDLLTIFCDSQRGWILTGGLVPFEGDSLGGAPLTDCELTDPMQ